jgi:hypothetical protein
MEDVSWIDRVRNEEVLYRAKEERNILHKIRRWIQNTYDWHCKNHKTTIRLIGHHHPRHSSLPHVHTSLTVSSIFGTLSVTPFLSQCQALSAIRPGSPQWYKIGILSESILFLEIGRNHRIPNQRSTVGGVMTAIFYFSINRWVRTVVWDGALSWWSIQFCSRQSSGRRLRTFSRSRRKTSQ